MSNSKSNVDEILAHLDDPRPVAAVPSGADEILAHLGKVDGDAPKPLFDPAIRENTKKTSWPQLILQAFLTGNQDRPVDSESRAMFNSISGPGGILQTAAMEPVRMATGTERPKDLWQRALRGDAYSMPEQLKQVGAPKSVQYGVGLPAAAVLDPYGALFAGASEAKPATTLRNFLAQNADQATFGIRPIAGGLKDMGKRAYRQSMRAADDFLKYRDSARFGQHDYSDILWNNGKPLAGGFGKTNQQIKEEIETLRRGAYDDMKNEMSAIGLEHPEGVDLAPNATSQADAVGQEAVNQHIDEAVEAATPTVGGYYSYDIGGRPIPLQEPNDRAVKQLVSQLGVDPSGMSLDEMKSVLAQAASDPETQLLQQVRNKAAGAAKSEMNEGLKAAFNGSDEFAREAAATKLKELAPDFAGLVDLNMNRFKEGGGDIAKKFFTDLIDDVISGGKRDPEQLHGLAVTYGSKAAGSVDNKTNVFTNRGKMNQRQVNQANQRATVMDVIDDKLAQSVDSIEGTAGAGAEAVQRLAAAKKKYGTLARGNKEAIVALDKAEKMPFFTAGDAFALGMTPINPKLGIAVAAKKANQLMTRSPRVSTGVGMKLNDLGQSNIWDAMLRQGLLNSVDNEENRVPGPSLW